MAAVATGDHAHLTEEDRLRADMYDFLAALLRAEPAEEPASAANEEASEADDESNRSAEQNQLPATESVKVDETTIDEAARPARAQRMVFRKSGPS